MTLIIAVDPSTAKLVASIKFPDATFKFEFQKLSPPSKEAFRDAETYNWLTDVIIKYRKIGVPVVVFIEKPIVFRSGQSTISLGQISGALRAAAINAGAQVIMVNNQTWKAAVIGSIPRGVKKADAVLEWMQENCPEAVQQATATKANRKGEFPVDGDALDAYAIMLYGAEVLSRVKRLRRNIVKSAARRVNSGRRSNA